MRFNLVPLRFLLLIATAVSVAACGFVDSAGNNSAPDISAADIQANEDEMVTLTSTVTDDFENIIKYEWAQAEGTPTVTLQGADTQIATFVAPNLVQNAILKFRITVTDNFDATSSADVTVGIAADNDPPVVTGETGSVVEGEMVTLDILANDTDPDEPGKILTAALASAPAQGTAIVEGSNLIYEHDGGEPSGVDTLTYTVSDGTSPSAPATVTINISGVNDPPNARSDNYTVNEDATLNVNAGNGVLKNDTDEEGVQLTVSPGNGPRNGALNINADGSFRYEHNGGETTSDSFTYSASDGNASDTATVNLTVNPVNDRPVAVNDPPAGVLYNVAPGQVLQIGAAQGVLANDTDAENDTLNAQLQTAPAVGVLQLNANGSFAYLAPLVVPVVNPVTFTYFANDGQVNSAQPATVSITVVAIAPLQANSCSVTTQDTALSGTLNAGILGAGPLTYALASAPDPRLGSVEVMADGDFVFTPAQPQPGDPGLRGVATFDYTATGSISVTRTQIVVIRPHVMSITATAPDGVGYRQSLAGSLANDNYQADFVGSQSSNGLADPEHEEYAGLTDAQAASDVYAWLTANPADVVLLNVGTHGLNDANDPNATSAADIRSILDEIDRWEADNNVPVTVMLARIIDQVDAATSTTNPNVMLFNLNLQALANARISAGDNLIVVDQHSALTYPDDLAADTTTPWRLYPDTAGYTKMADRWLEALDTAGVLPRCP